MSKLLEIHSCFCCKYCSHWPAICSHPKIGASMIEVDIYSEIPSWCPLPDAGEKQEDEV
jgi:hypothetical protein